MIIVKQKIVNFIIYKNKKIGFGVIEAIVAISIISVFAIIIISVNSFYLNMAIKSRNSISASFILEEGVEAIKSMRDHSWQNNIENLNTSTDYYLLFDNNLWSSVESVQMEGIFERKFQIFDVYRDANGDIVSSGGSLDPGTKLVLVSVSWQDKYGENSKSVKTYITKIFDN